MSTSEFVANVRDHKVCDHRGRSPTKSKMQLRQSQPTVAHGVRLGPLATVRSSRLTRTRATQQVEMCGPQHTKNRECIKQSDNAKRLAHDNALCALVCSVALQLGSRCLALYLLNKQLTCHW